MCVYIYIYIRIMFIDMASVMIMSCSYEHCYVCYRRTAVRTRSARSDPAASARSTRRPRLWDAFGSRG